MRLFFYILGFAVLLAGYIGAAAVWRGQQRLEAAPSPNAPLSVLDSRKDSRQMEMLEGKEGLFMEQCLQWLRSFLHGRRLAGLLVVGSSLGAIACFIAAAFRPFRGGENREGEA